MEKYLIKNNEVELFANLSIDGGDTSLVNAVLNSIKVVLESQNRLTIRNFGTFKRKVRPEKKCRNPKTGETVISPACDVVSFKPSKNFFIPDSAFE